MNNYKKYNAGFTLIELMVVIAIVGIFASIALPSFQNLIEQNRISTASNELVSNLLLAKSEALKRNQSVTLCPSSDQATCEDTDDFSKGWIVFLDCDDDLTINETVANCGTEDIIRVRDAFNSIHMENTSAKKITFQYTGRINNASTFEIGKNAETIKKEVVVNRIGRISVE